MSESLPPYSSGQCTFFWLLWLLGWGVCLAYIFALVFLVLYTKIDLASVFSTLPSALFTAWNLLAIGTQCYLLVQSARFLSRHEKPMSELLLRVFMAGIVVPNIAVSGCFMAGSFLQRMAV